MDIDKKNINSGRMFSALLRKKKLICTAISGFACIIVSLVLVICDPVPRITRYAFKVSEGSLLYNKLQEKLEGAMLEIYFFNITNADRFVSGLDDNLKLEEAGPFTYIQYRENLNMTIDDVRGIIRFTPNCTTTFVPHLSIGDPKKYYINMPNLALLALASRLARASVFLQIPFNAILRNLKSTAVLNVTVDEFLWGYDDPLISLGNTLFPGWLSFKKLGLLDRFFDPKRYKPMEMYSIDERKFEIKTINGFGGLNEIGYGSKSRSRCNTYIDAYEGMIFPYQMPLNKSVRIYHNILCRMLDLEYSHNTTMDYGSKGYVYKISRTAYDLVPDNKCLCPKQKCINGAVDISPCFYGMPMSFSNAHLLHAEEKAFHRIEGLRPNETRHGSEFIIDKVSGVSLAARFTVQANIVMGDVKFNKIAEAFSNMIVPFVWINVKQQPLPKTITLALRIVAILREILITIQVLLFITGCSLIVHTFYTHMCRESKTMKQDANLTKASQTLLTHKLSSTELKRLKLDTNFL